MQRRDRLRAAAVRAASEGVVILSQDSASLDAGPDERSADDTAEQIPKAQHRCHTGNDPFLDVAADPGHCVGVGDGEKVIGYVRVSTEEQSVSGAGLEAQRVAIQAECARRGWELAGVEKDVLSGKSLKPGLQAALESCRSGEVGGIVVAKLDRLSRSLVDFANLLEGRRRKGSTWSPSTSASTSPRRRVSSWRT